MIRYEVIQDGWCIGDFDFPSDGFISGAKGMPVKMNPTLYAQIEFRELRHGRRWFVRRAKKK
jgi:hypothetical protein